MKILKVSDADVDIYDDWLEEPAASIYIEGQYDHITDGYAIVACEVVKFTDDTLGVCLGEQIGIIYENT